MSTLKDLNTKLVDTPYVAGFTPSNADAKQLEQLLGANVNVLAWAARMSSYYASERAAFGPAKKASSE